jgi:molecular chaperone GrpE
MTKDKLKDKKVKEAYEEHNAPEQVESESAQPAPSEEAGPAQESSEETETVPMIALSIEEYDKMKQELELAQQQARDYSDGWTRERADFSNFRRRIEREQVQMTQTLTGQIIKKYLVIMDDLERALKNRPASGEGAAWAEGLELVVRKLQTLLENEGVVRIQADNMEFDPAIHEAISHEESPDHASGQIIEVVQQGYMIGDRILRAALVRVAR